MSEKSASDQFLAELQSILPATDISIDFQRDAGLLTDSRGDYSGLPLALVWPRSASQLQQIVRLCQRFQVAMVPQGGNTGRVGGAAVTVEASQLIINLARMNRIRAVDAADGSITVEAGCLLADVQAAAAAVNMQFPLRLGSEGSCQIGGNLASNAGGTNALRYGSARDLLLGIEAVLANGEALNLLSGVRKNNSGYAIGPLLVGSEGTLAIITAATLKLFPKSADSATALLAVASPEQALQAFVAIRAVAAEQLLAAELMSKFALSNACQHTSDCQAPFTPIPAWTLLLELSSSTSAESLNNLLAQFCSELIDSAVIDDAVLASGGRDAAAMWQLREAVVSAQRFAGASIKHDVSVPISALPPFINDVLQQVEKIVPGIRPCPFGHFGDGNLHFNLSPPQGMSDERFLQQQSALNRAVHDLALQYGGSFAAEHGIGQLRKHELSERADLGHMQVMRAIKQALDPHGLLNPGKIL